MRTGEMRQGLRNRATGAETLIYLASSDDASVVNAKGLYFNKCKVAKPGAEACDVESARRLWEVSEKLAADKTI
jgi:retinol dehydrogenase-12